MSARKVVGPDVYLCPEGITFSDAPVPARQQATDSNLTFWARENEMRAKRDEADPHTMTADKLAKKIPGMAAAVPFITGVGVCACRVSTHEEYWVAEGYLFREDDEDLLRAEQEAFRAEHPDDEPRRGGNCADGEGA